MGDVIWKFVGGVSAITGVVCFTRGSTYDISFRKLGRYVGVVVYLSVFIIMWCLVVGTKKILVPKKFQSAVGAMIFVAICSISVVHDKYVPGKSDAFTITSYGAFALMSVSMSKKLELGFETGFSTFFLQLFAAQLFKIKWFLLPIALVFCSLIIILRGYPEESKVKQAASITSNNGSHPPPNSVTIDVERQDFLRQSLLSTTNNQENNEAESSQAAVDRSPSIGQLPEGSMMLLDSGNQQNREEVSERSTILHPILNRQDFLRQRRLSTTNNQENDEAESSQATMDHSPSIGQVPEGSIMLLDSGNQQNREEVPERSTILHPTLNRQDFLWQSLLSTTNNQENNEVESSQAVMDRSPSIGQVLKGSMMSGTRGRIIRLLLSFSLIYLFLLLVFLFQCPYQFSINKSHAFLLCNGLMVFIAKNSSLFSDNSSSHQFNDLDVTASVNNSQEHDMSGVDSAEQEEEVIMGFG